MSAMPTSSSTPVKPPARGSSSWIVEGSGHAAAMVDHPAEYEHHLVDFFSETIGSGIPD